jgi:hypothetical protein
MFELPMVCPTRGGTTTSVAPISIAVEWPPLDVHVATRATGAFTEDARLIYLQNTSIWWIAY